jgi:hypothetical protein
MDTRRLTICTLAASFVVFAGCATSPEDEERRKAMEADVDEILRYELDPLEYGEPRKCLPESEYRSYRALGKRHLLFFGRQNRQWVNVLRGRCSNLSRDSIFIMEPATSAQLCELDRFRVGDRLDSVRNASMMPTCVLGIFKPVTEAQVKEIEARLEMR